MKVRLDQQTIDMIDNYPSATIEENLEKVRIYHSATSTPDQKSEALEWLITHNMRMVLHQMIIKYKNVSVDHRDLFMMGIIGLIKAIKKYSIESNKSLSTYAYHWIKKEMHRYLTNNATVVKYPLTVTETLVANRVKSMIEDGYDIDESVKMLKEKYSHYAKIPDSLIKAFVHYSVIHPSQTNCNVKLERSYASRSEIEQVLIDIIKTRSDVDPEMREALYIDHNDVYMTYDEEDIIVTTEEQDDQ